MADQAKVNEEYRRLRESGYSREDAMDCLLEQAPELDAETIAVAIDTYERPAPADTDSGFRLHWGG